MGWGLTEKSPAVADGGFSGRAKKTALKAISFSWQVQVQVQRQAWLRLQGLQLVQRQQALQPQVAQVCKPLDQRKEALQWVQPCLCLGF